MTISQNSTTSPSQLWTVEQVAAYLNFTPETVRNMARNGIIPALKVGKRMWRFRLDDIHSWLKNKAEPTDA